MPSVGTLNLKVESNASAVGSSLEDIAGALGRIKKAIPENGLGLPGIAEEIKTFVSTIKTIESSSTAFKSIESLGNGLVGIAKFLKYSTDSVKESTGGLNESISTINTQPAITAINQLKGAIGDGLKLGQSGTQLKNLKEALGGEWNTTNAENAGKALKFIAEGAIGLQGISLGTQAKNLSAMAGGISEFADSIEKLKTAAGVANTGSISEAVQTAQMTSVGGDAAKGYADGIQQGKEEAADAASEMAKAAIEAVQNTQESHSPSLVFMRLGVYAAEGYIEGVKSKMMDVAGTLADMTKTAIVSAKDEAPEAAKQVAEAIRSTFKTVLSSDLVPDAIKAPMSEGVERIASFVQALVGSASKDQYSQAATMASAAVREGLSTAISESFGLLKSETGVQAVGTEVAGIFKQVETPIQHVNSELQETKQTVEGVANACKPAKAIIASTLKEFEKSEKNGSFASWMYGPRPQVPYTNQIGMQSGYQTDAEASAKNPQWYQPEEFYQRMAAAAQSAQQPVERLNEAVQQTMQGTATPDTTFVDNLISGASEVDLLKMKVEDLTAKLYDGVSAGTMTGDQIASTVSQIQTLNEKISELVAEQEHAESMAGMLGAAWGALGGAMQRLFPTISSMLKRFKQIVKYRLLRSVLRHITAGFSEGVKNVYEYSKAIGSSLSVSMDDASTALLKMKNSIGAATAPLIQALIPVLQTVVNWVISAVNWLNQFFALLTGQKTWTRAIDYASQAYGNNTKAAKNAAKAAKDLLADWDELNIIQSQGGNGGGGSGSTNTPDYSKMFEEVNKFSDSVKDAIKFIEDHLGGLKGLFAKLGALLLGWKFSKAFSGFLGTLGKLVAGGALVTLGVELSFGAGYNAGAKGFFDTKDIITAIGGALATAIGGSLITTALGFGGTVGFGIGIGVAVIATLSGWIEGTADFMDKMKWGNQEMSPDQIESFVKSKFSFNIDAEIELLGANIKDRENAKTLLETDINKFTSKLTLAKVKVGMKADDAPLALLEAYTSATQVLSTVQSFIDTNEDALVATLSISPMKDGEGKDITNDVLAQITFADKTLKQYFIDMGKELADAIYQGERDGWTEGEMENVLALLEHQRNIMTKAEEMQRDLEFEMDVKFNLNNLTRDNAKEVFEAEKQRIEEYKEKFMKDRNTARDAAIQELAWTEAAIEDYKAKGLDTTDLEKAAASYRQIINDYLDPKKAEEAWKLKLQESMGWMKQEWIEAMTGLYGIGPGEQYNESTLGQKLGGWKPASTNLVDALLSASGSKDPVAEGTKALKTYFEDVFNTAPDYIKEIISQFGISAWDLADDSIREGLVTAIRNSIGNDDYAKQILQNMGISVDELQKYFNTPIEIKTDKKTDDWGIFDIFRYHPPEEEVTVPVTVTPEVEVDKLKDLKEEIEAAMSDGIMSTDEAFDLMIKYGTNEFDQAMKELQYNLDDEGRNRGTNLLQSAAALLGNGQSANASYGRLGSTGIMDVSPTTINPSKIEWNPSQSTGTQEAQAVDYTQLEHTIDNGIDYTQMETSVKNGATKANEDMVSELRTAVQVLQRILAKPWVVNVQPTSGLGRTVGAAGAALGKVTGD